MKPAARAAASERARGTATVPLPCQVGRRLPLTCRKHTAAGVSSAMGPSTFRSLRSRTCLNRWACVFHTVILHCGYALADCMLFDACLLLYPA